MKRTDVRDQLASGTSTQVRTAVENLAWRIEGLSGADAEEGARKLLTLVLFHFLAQNDPAMATAFSTRWMTNLISAEGERTREHADRHHDALVELMSSSNAFSEDLRTLHPWRQETAKGLAETWPPIRQLVHTLTRSKSGRGAILAEWVQTPPAPLVGAPAEAWCLLGEIAGDYDARTTAADLFERGIDQGAHPRAYWHSRAALLLAEQGGQRATEFASRGAEHPLGRAISAELQGDTKAAAAAIEGWKPESIRDVVIHGAALARVRFADRHRNAAIAGAEELAARFPEANGLAITAAELLLHRAQSGTSERPSDDAQRALNWALKARNSRRTWFGDAGAAVVMAVKAAALLHDLRRALQLALEPPAGEATALEAAHPEVLREAAITAAMLGHEQLAAELAQQAADPYVDAFIAAVLQSAAEDPSALASWRRAFDAAPSDVQRLQTAYMMLANTGELPNLSGIDDAYATPLAELKDLGSLPQEPSQRLVELRSRASVSQRMTVELASHYADLDEHEAAGRALEDGGNRWSNPILLRMAATHYREVANHAAVQRAALAALRLAPSDWGGESDTRKLLFEALYAQGMLREATQEASVLVALDPSDISARWAHIYCLARQGKIELAWNVLTPDGNPIAPRDRDDVRSWVSLLTQFDQSPHYLRRVLGVLSQWQDDEEIVGVCISLIYGGLRRYGHDPADADVEALQEATRAFLERFPQSTYFGTVEFDPQDPLAFIADDLRERHERLTEVDEMVRGGRLPIGLAATLFDRTYTEAALQRLGGMVRSHNPGRASQAMAHAADALNQQVVLDLSAAVTLATLPPELATELTGRFERVSTTDRCLQDAMNAQASLGMRSDTSVTWDPQAERPRVVQIDQSDVERLASVSTRVVDRLTIKSRGVVEVAARERSAG